MFKFFCALMIAAAGSAGAETIDLGSQYQHQTGDRKIELTPGFGWNQTKTDATSGTASYKGWRGFLKAEYGTSEAMSIGFLFDYGNAQYTATQTVTRKGLQDPEFFLNARQMVGPGSLRYGFALDMAVEDHIVGSSGDTNRSSGGVSLRPYVGYEWQTGPHTLGARVSYSANIHDGKVQDKRTTPETESRIKGGNSLYSALFYEADITPLILGASVGIRNTERTHEILNQQAADLGSSYSSIGGQVYGAWLATSSITLLPAVAYTEVTALPAGANKIHAWEFALSARFEF